MTETTHPNARLDDLLQQALEQLNRNGMIPAEALLSQVLASAPQDAQALQLMGVVRRMQGRREEAELLYRQSLAANPLQPQVHHNLGNLLTSLARFHEAADAQREAIRLKPNYAEAHLSLAIALSALGDHQAAEKSCRNALRIQPNYLLAKQTLAAELNELKRPKEAETVARQTLALGSRDPRQLAALEHNLALSLKMQRRYAEALPLFDSAQAKAPDMPAVDYNRGNTLQHMDRFEEGVESYRRALARDPLDLFAHRDLNQLLYRLGDDENFLKSYDEAAALHPESGVLAIDKGNLLYLKEDFAGARSSFERAVSLLPGDAVPHDGLALALARLNDLDGAIREHEIAARMEPQNARVWRGFAETLLRAQDARGALAAAERALAIEPENQGAIARWGIALRLLSDPREERINDCATFVQVYDVAPPEGYSDMECFNRDLNLYLDRLHRDKRECIDQTLRSGTQTLDNLFGAGHNPVEQLRRRIDDAVADYIGRLQDDPDHPFLKRRRRGFEYAASWSSRLHDCGFHTNHVHPKGWISSAYYVGLPPSIDDSAEKQGWIKFGEPNIECGLTNPIRRMVRPQIGTLVLFPSYMWHGTLPFHDVQSRTTIAFDVVPQGQ